MPAIFAYEHELLGYATQALASVRGYVPSERLPSRPVSSRSSWTAFQRTGRSPSGSAWHRGAIPAPLRQPTVRRYGLNGTVRPSLAFYNTRDEIDRFSAGPASSSRTSL